MLNDNQSTWKWVIGIIIGLFLTLGGGSITIFSSNTKIHENHEQRIKFLEKQTVKSLDNIFEKLDKIESKFQHVNCKMDVK